MHLFLSPHFDDAVLSCGGKIYQLSQAGEVVMVRTVMGQKPKRIPDSPIVQELHKRWGNEDQAVDARIKEDENAVRSLNAIPQRMVVWPDCIYRLSRDNKALYPSEESLFGDVQPEDMAGQLIPTIVLPPRDDVKVVYAALGVGHHVDHLIVRDWALELQKQNPPLEFKLYEEYPYSEKSSAVDDALFYFKENGIRLELETVYLSDAAVEAKIRAIAHYRSQISTFWANADTMRQTILQHVMRAGGDKPAERYWRVVSQ